MGKFQCVINQPFYRFQPKLQSIIKEIELYENEYFLVKKGKETCYLFTFAEELIEILKIELGEDIKLVRREEMAELLTGLSFNDTTSYGDKWLINAS